MGHSKRYVAPKISRIKNSSYSYNEMDIVTVRMYGWIYLCTYGLIYTELDCYTLIPSYYYSDAWCSITRTIL
jgi:hypothetical protein